MEKVLLITNDNQYLSKNYFSSCLAKAFERLGLKTEVIHPQNGQLRNEDILQFRKAAPDLTCSFNTIFALPNNEYLWDLLETPHLFINLDSAIYSLHYRGSPYIAISCVDRFDLPVMRAHNFSRTFFLPHACDASLSFDDQGERPYDVVMIGSCYDHEALRREWRRRLSPNQSKVVDEAVELALDDPSLHFMEAVAAAFSHSGLEPGSVDFRELCVYVDYFLRGRDRWELVRALKDVDVHVFGEVHAQTDVESRGWAGYAEQHPNLHLHPPCSYEEGLQILHQSKICLNSAPTFKEAGHERIFHGLALGAIPLTTHNSWLAEEFVDGESLLSYRRGDWADTQEKVLSILSDETRRQSMVDAGRHITLSRHTWDQRAELIIDLVPGLFPGHG